MQRVYHPLTQAQKRIWYTEQFYPGTGISNLGGFAKLKCEEKIDLGLLMDSIRQFIRLNDSMRLRLSLDGGGEPRQYVSEYREIDIEYVECETPREAQSAIEWGQSQAGQPMSLYDADLFQFALFKIADKECWLFAKIHHVISDGISMVLLMNEIIDLYLGSEKETQNASSGLPSYLEHLQSEREYEQSDRFRKDKEFWNAQFASVPELSSLRRMDTNGLHTGAVRHSNVIPESLQQKIQFFCKEYNLNPLSLFLSILYIYLHRVTRQEDVVVGTFMANRTNAKEKRMLGMLVSTLPVRAAVDENMDFLSFVRNRSKDLMTLIRHQKYPYNVLVNDLREKSGHVNRLFAVSLEYQVMQWQQKENISFLTEPFFSGNEINDISFHVKERWDTGTLQMDIDYRSVLFAEEEIENLYRCLSALLQDALSDPSRKICELDICPEDERRRLLEMNNGPKITYPLNMPLLTLFERQAEENPDRLAVVYGEHKRLTYKELNERSNRVARVLRTKGVGPDSAVAICMERSEGMIEAILAVLKAGGAYVPIDPHFPGERIRFILQDAGAKTVITQRHLAGRDELKSIEPLVFDDALFNEGESGNLSSTAAAHHLAYIIYTSGTSGKPKGVMVEHRQVQHLVESLRTRVYASYNTALNVALVAPFHFDASVQQIFASLLLGHTLFIVPKATISDGPSLADYYRSHRIDVTDGTPAHLQMLLAAGNVQGLTIRQMLIGGEVLPREIVRQFLDLFSRSGHAPTITNVYGPTECCVDASAFEIGMSGVSASGSDSSPYIPIGMPLGNNRFYILDANGRLLPAGVPGELYIAGDGVGRGYLNLPGLSAEQFVSDPFVHGERMFKTGDLASRLPDGNVQFLGRMDAQVKIRGYRIELGEVEAVLRKHPRILQAVVLAIPQEKTGAELCAYVELKDAEEPVSFKELKDHSAGELPNYMIPNYYVQVDGFPLTPSGKLDSKALLRYEPTVAAGTGDYVPPADETERRLAAVWQEVLSLQQVGMGDHFFESGGHSLKAIVLLSRVHQEFGVEVPLQTLFELPTVRAMARHISGAARSAFLSIEPAQPSSFYPLSSAQQRVYIASQIEEGKTGYNMPAAALLEGEVDFPRLEQAFRGLIRRHETLRTSFITVDGVPMQQIREDAAFEIARLESGESTIESAMASFVRPFDLSRAPLMRAGLMALAENRHMLLFDMHHLVSDGVSVGILLNELARLYGGEQLPELRLQYKDFAVWQSGRITTGYGKEEAYWLAALDGELPVLQLPFDDPRPAVQSFAGDRATVFLEKGLKDKLDKLAGKTGTTLYMVMLAAYYVLLARYTGQEDIVVGTPAAGRNHTDLENILGMFVNTLAIRAKPDRLRTFTEFLQEVRRQVLDAVEHQDYPFERLVEKLNLPRDLSRNPLFDTFFVLQNAFEGIPRFGGMGLSIHETNFHIAKFDLTLQAKEERDGIMLDMDYCTRLFRRETAERMLGHYHLLLQSIVADPAMKLGEYSLLAKEEKNRLVAELNPPMTEYPRERTIVQLFEEQAGRGPHRTALSFEGSVLTYGELNGRANQLAKVLRSKGVGSGTAVAMLVNRSLEMAVGVLAILKAGAAYVPIDPEHPIQRIGYFLSDSKAAVLLTQRSLISLVNNTEVMVDCVLADDEDIYRGDSSNLGTAIHPGQLANLTYTSGTTGNPKGNRITHANILRTVTCTNYLEITDEDVLIGLSNYVFDAFMFDLFGALLNGAKLVLVPKITLLDISRLPQVIGQERVTVMMITTALFNLLIDFHPDCLSGLRKVLFGGERASVGHVREALKAAGKGKLLHMYGPSESTVFATYYPVDEVAEDAGAIPIGKPVSNTSVYILDSFRQPQPVGMAGELCVGGEGLVQGYENRPELTDEKFVPDPFRENSRMYMTGDLARWLPDGNIEFIGRKDHQVKIRGQRIELGEIEHQLLSHESVKEAVVLAVDAPAGDKQLCAYFVAGHALSGSELREHAAKELPAYMVPSLFVQLGELPLTGSGKVDRRALPKPDSGAIRGVEYAAARTETEAKLVAIWQEVLGIGQIGVHDHFFELGGHSLKAMAMLARIHRELHVELSLREVFQSPTIAALAQVLAQVELSSFVSIAPAEQRESYPVTSAQKRLYVLHQLEGADASYHIPTVLRLKGPLRRERIETAIQELVRRHDAFRTFFDMVDGEPVQKIREKTDFTVSYMEAAEQEAPRLIREFIRPFDLQKAPLFRAGLIRIAEEDHLFCIDMHHIISDGTSAGVLMEEITKLYAGETLLPLPIQYKDYAVWQQAYVQTEKHRDQENYWLDQLSGELPALNLPADEARPAVQSFVGDRVNFTVNSGLAQSLRKLARETETTLYMVLLAAYGAFLGKLSGQNDIVIGSPIAGRPHEDLMGIVGMFVNTLAVRTYPQGEKTFSQYLQELKRTALGAHQYQNYPLEELVNKLQTQRDMSRNPLFDAVFAMQNADVESLAMDGLEAVPYPFEQKSAKFDLTLTATESKDTIRFQMEFNTALFKPDTVDRWTAYFKQLLGHIAMEPDVKLSEANMLTKAEEQRILVEFNATKRVYPREKTIHGLFEDQAERVPDNTAVVFGNVEMTYRELNAKANQLARKLRDKGLSADKIAGIMGEQSIETVVGILAILKAGGAYLPIDPDYPDERVRYLIEDSGMQIVLTERRFADRLQGVDVLLFDDPVIETAEPVNLAHVNRPEGLAYVIYTSGSTGQPKGVMVEHRNVVRLVKNAGYIPLDETCRMAQTGAVSFDASTFEFFGALLNGGTLYPVPKSVLLDAIDFTQFLQRHRITTMWLTSPLFNQLAQEDAEMFAGVRHLIIGGDALLPRHVNEVRRVCPGLSLWNGYGPTENTTFSTCFLIEKDFTESIPIGKPLGNSTAYIVNSGNHPQPIGIPGELCVGGDGVARGYLNNPDLTREKFVDNPFVPGERMYRTGDSARWLPDGNIEFLGRIDQQVKVRGYRIELGEIQSQLMRVDGVTEALVIARLDEAGQNVLCAYVKGKRELPPGELRAALSRSLPGYMLPSYFVQIAKMPLMSNGKIDRRALPDPDVELGREEYRVPGNEKEELLCRIWQDVLGVKQIGIGDNFFSLGGDSIKAIQMSARLHKHGWKLEMKDLFQHPTIEHVSVYLQWMQGAQANQIPVVGEVPLTPIQRWFFGRRTTDMHHWNQAVMLYAPAGFQPQPVERTLRKLAEHHDALRMGYELEDGRVVQYNYGPADAVPELEVIRPDVPAVELERAILRETERIQGSIDLSGGPLLKAALFQTELGDHLLIIIHHLVVDGVSWRILLEDLAGGYLQATQGGEIVFPEKSHSYREWAAALQEYADSKTLLKEIEYWSRLETAAVVPLPKDHEAGDCRMRHARSVQFSLTAAETEQLTTRVHLAYRTEMNDILLTGLGLAFQEWTGEKQVLVNMEGHGREEIIAEMDVSRTVGWFTTQYPVVLDMNYAADPAYQIKRVKEDLRHIPNKGIGYGLLRYLTPDERKSGDSSPVVPEIGFNYLGQFAETTGTGMFERSSLSTGSSLSPDTEMMHPIDIGGAIEGGKLRMTVAYNSLVYDERTMLRLSESFKAHLLSLINHCLNQESGALTPSDLGDDDLTLEELDKLMEIL